MIMAKTAYRGATIASLRNLSVYRDNGAEYALATSEPDLLDLVPDQEPDLRTEGQIRFMEDLIAELTKLDGELGRQAREYTDSMTERGRWTSGREGNASTWIDRMIVKRDQLRQAERAGKAQARQGAVKIEDGMYLLDGEIFKVQHAVHGSGKQYATQLIPNEPGQKATFIYVPGVVSRLRPEHRMTKEKAKQWGALYGTCVRCGAVLTAEDSIDRMMGPICATKL